MKKIAAWIILAVMILPGLALGENAEQTIHLGDTVLTEDLEITVIRSEVRPSLIGSKGNGRTLNPSDKSQYFCIWGTITNNGVSELKLDHLYAEAVFNEKYRYKTEIYVDYEGQLRETLDPLCDADLVIVAKIPNKLVGMMESCQVELAFYADFTRVCNSLENCDFRYTIAFDRESTEQAKEGPVREDAFFKECPALPLPESFMDAHEVSSYHQSAGKRSGSIKYSYSLTGHPDNANEIYRTYVDRIAEGYGFACYREGDEYKADLGGKTVAYINCNNMFLEITVVPGNEHLKPVRESGFVSEEASPNGVAVIGQTLRAKTCTFRPIESGKAKILYSCITEPKIDRWQYVETQSGIYVYLLGELANNGSHPIDPRNIFAEVIVDDKHYDGFSRGVGEKQKVFLTDLPAGFKTKVYIVAEVQPILLENAKSVVIRFGFTEDFSIIHTSNGIPDFSYCTDVYEFRVK